MKRNFLLGSLWHPYASAKPGWLPVLRDTALPACRREATTACSRAVPCRKPQQEAQGRKPAAHPPLRSGATRGASLKGQGNTRVDNTLYALRDPPVRLLCDPLLNASPVAQPP